MSHIFKQPMVQTCFMAASAILGAYGLSKTDILKSEKTELTKIYAIDVQDHYEIHTVRKNQDGRVFDSHFDNAEKNVRSFEEHMKIVETKGQELVLLADSNKTSGRMMLVYRDNHGPSLKAPQEVLSPAHADTIWSGSIPIIQP